MVSAMMKQFPPCPAKRLGWQLIDHALVERVASELGTSLEEAEAHDEQSAGVIAQLVNSKTLTLPRSTGRLPFPGTLTPLPGLRFCLRTREDADRNESDDCCESSTIIPRYPAIFAS